MLHQNVGDITIPVALLPAASLANLLVLHSSEVNIFLKLHFWPWIDWSVMKAVANLVFAGLSNSLCPVNSLIILTMPTLLYKKPLNSIPFFRVFLIAEILWMSSNIRSIQWAAQGVQYKCRCFSSNSLPNMRKGLSQ